MWADLALRLPLLAPLALAGGAAAYFTLSFEPHWSLGAALAIVAGAAWLALRRHGQGWIAFLLLLIACAGLGVAAGQLRTALVAAPVLVEQTRPVRIEGVIAELDASDSSRRVRLQTWAIEGLTPQQTPRFVRFSIRNEIDFLPGRAVACRAMLSPPPRPTVPGDYRFHRDAWFQQLGGVGFAVGACQPLALAPVSDAGEVVGLWIGAIRRALAVHVAEAAGPAGGGMAAAMISGDRSFITAEDADALRLSGLTHLLSISGVHMVLVGGAVFFALRLVWPVFEPLALRVPAVHVAAFGAIVACTLYFLISGMEVATQRAYVMALVGFGAKLLDRPAISMRSLAVAMFIVVLLQPESVVAPGFQMSFAASAGLVALYELWPRLDRPEGAGPLGRFGGWIIGAAATSLVASLATMPFALHHFDRAAIFSVIANMAATPIISFWTTPAALAAAFFAPVGLDGPFLALMGMSLDLVIRIGHWSATAMPPVDLPRLDGAAMALSALAIGLFCVARGPSRLVSLVPAVVASILWAQSPVTTGYVSADGSVFLKAEEGWVELTEWRGENGLNPLGVRGPLKRDPCGRPRRRPDPQFCSVELPSGVFSFERLPAAEPQADAAATSSAGSAGTCPTTAPLLFRPKARPEQGAQQQEWPEITLHPCILAGQGGAVIGVRFDGEVAIATQRVERNRPWAP